MIITLTLNPGLDLTYGLHEATLGEVDVHRAESATVEPSGKGVNVSLTLARAGVSTVAVVLLGGLTGRHLSDLLGAERLEHVVVPVDGQTRINTSVTMPGGRTTKVNGPGPRVGAGQLAGLWPELRATLDGLRAQGEGEHWLALCGSLPPGVEADVVAEAVQVADEYGIRCVVDVSGPALRRALLEGADLLAPNAEELSVLVGAGLDHTDVDAVAVAASHLAREHGTAVLVSLGSRGALYTDGSTTLWGTGPALTPVNTAGAGDALLAGWLSAPGDPASRMQRALAFGRSACLSPFTVDRTPGRHASEGLTVRTVSPYAQTGEPDE